jgi:hypothetical protein
MSHLNEDDVHVAIFNRTDFLTTGELTEHATFNTQALVKVSITSDS